LRIPAFAAFGRRFNEHFRLEIEAGLAHFQPDHVNPVSPPFAGLNGQAFKLTSGGNYERYTGSINAFFDVATYDRVTFYIGDGIGYAHAVQSAAQFTAVTGGHFNQFAATADNLLVLGEGGPSIAITPSLSVVPAYRYEHYFFNANRFGDEEAHIFKLGLRYTF